MKCPECGQWNRASMPHCIRCGAPLNIDAASRLEWKDSLRDGDTPTAYLRADEFGQTVNRPEPRDQLAREMQDLKKRKQEGADLQKRLREASSGRIGHVVVDTPPKETKYPRELHHRDTVSMHSDSEDSRASRNESEIRRRVRYMDDSGAYMESRTWDPLTPSGSVSSSSGYSLTESLSRSIPSRKSRRAAVLRTFLVLLLIGALGVAGWYGYRYFSGRGTPQENDPGVIITSSILDGLAAHTVLIPGEEGTSIYVRELHASYNVVDGFATLEIPDHTWYDNLEGTLNDTMEVTMTPFLKSSAGRQVPMTPITYEIDIPLSPVELESPDSLRTNVSTTMTAIKIVVRPGSRVTINGNDCSDTVSSETGEMTYNATVQPIGDNVFNIVVRSQYCRDNSLTVILYREKQEIPLDLAVGTYGTTNNRIMRVSATTLPGAYVTVTTPHSDLDITDLDSKGKFSFNAVFDKIGNNTISIEASYPGKKTSVVNHVVYYLPPASEYTVRAWPLSADGYSELLSNMSVRAARSQVYVVTGVVQSQESEKPQRVIINTSEDGKSQPVLLENYTKTKWVVGTYYRIYADAFSLYNGMPWLNARYTYAK
jgi:hypothetical protein